MEYKYLCRECGFSWNPLNNKSTDLFCPICKSRKVVDLQYLNKSQKMDIMLSGIIDTKKEKFYEYVVPWMISIQS
jgi:uncharacterized Zn finger protein (UPF0148 family)